MTNALKILLSLSFGMPIVAVALAISWGHQMQEHLTGQDRDRAELVATSVSSAPDAEVQ